MTDARAIIIMPAHNEAANLPLVFEDLRHHAPDLDVVVVDDASSDETPAIAAQLGAIVVTLPCNLGYGGAVQTGFKYAVENGYDYAVMMDADGQHDPEFIWNGHLWCHRRAFHRTACDGSHLGLSGHEPQGPALFRA
jgi:glycosyltransferase involved in cell wall biosynthesis